MKNINDLTYDPIGIITLLVNQLTIFFRSKICFQRRKEILSNVVSLTKSGEYTLTNAFFSIIKFVTFLIFVSWPIHLL